MSLAYENVLENALEASKDPDNHFVVDVIAQIGVSNVTFYKYVSIESDGYAEVMENLRKNRAATKKAMRKKWSTNGHPTLQVSLMKLIGTDEERRALSQTHVDVESGGKPLNTGFDMSKLSTSALLELAKAYDKQTEDNKDE